MRARRAEIVPVRAMAHIGMAQVWSTWCILLAGAFGGGFWEGDGLTFLKRRERGRPLSREKAQACRDAEAMKPKVAKTYIANRTEMIAVVPALDWMALRKISMKGSGKLELIAAIGLPKQ